MNVNDYVKSMLESTKESVVGLDFDMRFDVVDFIRKELAEKGLTQKQLALRMKMKDSQLTRILNAENNITLETIARIYHAFGCKPIITERPVYNLISDQMKRLSQTTIADHQIMVRGQNTAS